MPAPKRPNTAPATKALIRRGQETMAAKLREAGWGVLTPEHIAAGWTITPPPKVALHPAQLMPAPKGHRCPACSHSTTVHRVAGCDVDGCDCPAPYGRIMPGDADPT